MGGGRAKGGWEDKKEKGRKTDLRSCEGEEEADNPHPESERRHFWVVDVGHRRSYLRERAVFFIFDLVKVELHPGRQSAKA